MLLLVLLQKMLKVNLINVKKFIPLFIVLFVILIDQVTKIYIKSHYQLSFGNSIVDWGLLKIEFVENPGMAFGFSFDNSWSKYLLSIFRFVAVLAIGWYILKLIKHNANSFLIYLVSLIFAGAVGNIIDNLFYGLIFDSGTTWNEELGIWIGYHGVSEPNFDGYGSFLNGCVVDMFHLYIPLPDWVPFNFGEELFPPVFNLADSSISVSVFLIIIFYKKIVRKSDIDLKWDDENTR